MPDNGFDQGSIPPGGITTGNHESLFRVFTDPGDTSKELAMRCNYHDPVERSLSGDAYRRYRKFHQVEYMEDLLFHLAGSDSEGAKRMERLSEAMQGERKIRQAGIAGVFERITGIGKDKKTEDTPYG
jgi:hypothetical protein